MVTGSMAFGGNERTGAEIGGCLIGLARTFTRFKSTCQGVWPLQHSFDHTSL